MAHCDIRSLAEYVGDILHVRWRPPEVGRCKRVDDGADAEFGRDVEDLFKIPGGQARTNKIIVELTARIESGDLERGAGNLDLLLTAASTATSALTSSPT